VDEARTSTAAYVCPACAGREWAETVCVYSRVGEKYVLLRCVTCGVGRLDWDPQPAELESLYGAEYYSQNVLAAPSLRTRTKAYLSSRNVGMAGRLYRWLSATWLPAPRPGRFRLLDVGCGDGTAMQAARRVGWLPDGCEVSEGACAVARQRGFRCFGGDWEDKLPQESYDMVLLSHVLEHLEEPLQTLKTLRGTLRPGGALLVGMPNLDSSLGRAFGEAWIANPVPEHLWHFTHAHVLRMIEAAGYHVCEVRRQSALRGTLAPHLWWRQWQYASGQHWSGERIAGAFLRGGLLYARSHLDRSVLPAGEGLGFALLCGAKADAR
jgi:SAM-dependent methyltransferase